MTTPLVIHRDRGSVPLSRRLAAKPFVGLARLISKLPPHRIRKLLNVVRIGARPASHEQAKAARTAVVATSVVCAGQGCVPRSIATALLCRAQGTWPTWCVGVRAEPFYAHAWVEADGRLVEESFQPGYFRVLMNVAPTNGRGVGP